VKQTRLLIAAVPNSAASSERS